MSEYEDFYKNLIISDVDRPRAERYLKAKGIKKHLLVKEYLQPWSKTEDVKYTQIASTYRYDKRIRMVLYKYISYLEEWYRSIILDNFTIETIYEINPTKEFQNKISQKNDLNDALEAIEFSTLLANIRHYDQFDKKLISFQKKHIGRNFSALRELRNSVMHNKLLVLYRGFEECYVNNKEAASSTISANILNLISFLPKEVGEKCKKEINNCSKNKNTNDDTKWDIPRFIIIRL